MGLLLYKSDEMYSSTELIRKSKMIFDKILEDQIDKAIILRDGRPCFLLMEFKKYETIMAEYEELKEYVHSLQENGTKTITPVETKKKNKKIKKQEILETNDIKIPPTQITQAVIPKVPIQIITPEDKKKIEKISTKIIPEEQMSEEQEINNALQSIQSMNFDDDMREEAELKIKARILEARAERAKILSDEKQHQEDLKEELILQNQLKETKMKKDRELQEFWD